MDITISPQILTVVEEAARNEQIDPEFVVKVVQTESRGDPSAKSPTGAIGLGQVTSAALAEFNNAHGSNIQRVDLYIPEVNARVTAWYLKWVASVVGVKDTMKLTSAEMARIYAGYNVGVGTLKNLETGAFSKAEKYVSVQAAKFSKDGPQGYLSNVANHFA